MVSIRGLIQAITIAAIIGAALIAVPPAQAITFGTITVNTTANTLADGHCSLQEAINLVNGVAGSDTCSRVGSTGIDTINFNIGASGSTQTITLTSPLALSSPVFLNGASQPGFNTSTHVPLIVVTNSTTSGLFQFLVGSGGSTVRAMRLTETAAGSGYDIFSIFSDYLTVQGCYLNTDGTSVVGASAWGLLLASSNNTIGGLSAGAGNLFGGAGGVRIDGGSGSLVEGNYFGVRADGVTPLSSLPASDAAIESGLYGGSSSIATGSVIRGNVITGYLHGIDLHPFTNSNLIVGNKIGVGANGSTRLGNNVGLQVFGSYSNTIGGTTAGDRNIISGNVLNIVLDNWHIDLTTYVAFQNVIKGNYVGTTANGLGRTTPYGDSSGDLTGIDVRAGDQNYIGGTAAGSGNLISGNSTGVLIESGVTGTTIQSNTIGTNVGMTSALRQVEGIEVQSGSSAAIGDGVTLGRNIISGNDVGIQLGNSPATTVYGNGIGQGALGTAIPNQQGIVIASGSVAAIAQNWIGYNSVDGVMVDAASSTTSSTGNCFTHNTGDAARGLNVGTPASLGSNWWGNSTGPTHSGNPGGTGDVVTDNVTYAGFLTSVPAACHVLFDDVPVAGKEWMEPWIYAFYRAGVTTGCGSGPLIYCPENKVTRAEMSVFLLRAKHGMGYGPPPLSHFFSDMPVTGKEWMEPWVDEFYREGLTTGCGGGNYCPESNVTRAEMAVFVLRSLHGGGYTPPALSHFFGDVPVSGKEWMEPWIDEFYREGITTGCGGGNYCPEDNVTRAEMAVFIGRAYGFYP